MNNNKFEQPLDIVTFLRVRKWYLLALAGIALTIIAAQILVQVHLNSQLGDSRVINVAGRQRAYSQKLVKEVLLLNQQTNTEQKQHLLKDIKNTLAIWNVSHNALQFGNDSMGIKKETHEDILVLFKKINPHHAAMVNAANAIITSHNVTPNTYQKDVKILLDNEQVFLKLMDTIVNEYDIRSKKQLQNLKYKEYLLVAFSLLILLLEILLIFKPNVDASSIYNKRYGLFTNDDNDLSFFAVSSTASLPISFT